MSENKRGFQVLNHGIKDAERNKQIGMLFWPTGSKTRKTGITSQLVAMKKTMPSFGTMFKPQLLLFSHLTPHSWYFT